MEHCNIWEIEINVSIFSSMVANFQNKINMENTNEVLADVMLSFLNFVREQKPTMVNHGEKINLFELERLVEKFKNRA